MRSRRQFRPDLGRTRGLCGHVEQTELQRMCAECMCGRKPSSTRHVHVQQQRRRRRAADIDTTFLHAKRRTRLSSEWSIIGVVLTPWVGRCEHRERECKKRYDSMFSAPGDAHWAGLSSVRCWLLGVLCAALKRRVTAT